MRRSLAHARDTISDRARRSLADVRYYVKSTFERSVDRIVDWRLAQLQSRVNSETTGRGKSKNLR